MSLTAVIYPHRELGPLWLAATEKALIGLAFEGGPGEQTGYFRRAFGAVPRIGSARTLREHPVLQITRHALERYFMGALSAFDGLPVLTRGTDFQNAVWAALRDIAPGKTQSYREMAEAIGRPKAVRAIGQANNANPIALVLPCHRVIGADGSLTGYGGGMARKQYLLEHEKAPVAQCAAAPA